VRGALVLALLGTLGSCTDPSPGAELGAERALEGREAPRPSARLVEVRAPRDVSILESPAIVRADPASAGEIGSAFRAQVSRVHVRVGERVDAGDPVVDVIAPEVIEAAATRVAVERRLVVHRARAEELQRLREEGYVDAARVFEQRTTIAELEAERDRALATLRAAGVEPRHVAALTRRGTLTLRAPVSGVIVALDASPGEIREAGGAPFARVRGAGEIRVEVRTSEPWPGGEALTLEVPGERALSLVVEPLVSTLDPDTGTRLHWFVPEQPRALPDGLRGTVRLAPGGDVWEVPAGAILQDADGVRVVRVRDGSEDRVAVEIVASSGASALVRGALAPGDRVAVGPRP
jgi:membrane fusion protein, heavy metal efflux system